MHDIEQCHLGKPTMSKYTFCCHFKIDIADPFDSRFKYLKSNVRITQFFFFPRIIMLLYKAVIRRPWKQVKIRVPLEFN